MLTTKAMLSFSQMTKSTTRRWCIVLSMSYLCTVWNIIAATLSGGYDLFPIPRDGKDIDNNLLESASRRQI